jgi:hypothetical protein
MAFLNECFFEDPLIKPKNPGIVGKVQGAKNIKNPAKKAEGIKNKFMD